jgi:hypothetical protein
MIFIGFLTPATGRQGRGRYWRGGRQPAASASAVEQNHRSPLAVSITNRS